MLSDTYTRLGRCVDVRSDDDYNCSVPEIQHQINYIKYDT